MGVCESNTNLVEHVDQHTKDNVETEENKERKKRKMSLQNKINMLKVATEKINRYKKENTELKEENTELNEINNDLKGYVNDKNIEISQIENDLKEMEYKMLKLMNESIERKQGNSINDILYKVHGDNINKLKYNKMSAKFVIFISGINHLFYYDETIKKSYGNSNNKSEPKCIVIRDITISNNVIGTQISNKPWFLVIGIKRKILFITGSISIRNKWFDFIHKSLKNKQTQNKIKIQINNNIINGNYENKIEKIEHFESKCLKFNYPSKIENCSILNNGHTVQININNINNNKCTLTTDTNEIYQLKRFHFNIPSEHTINNNKYEMEMHLIHINNKTNKIIVLCFIFTNKQKYKNPKLQLNASKTHLILSNHKSNNSLSLSKKEHKKIIKFVKPKILKNDNSQPHNETLNETLNETHIDNNTNNKYNNNFLNQFWDELPLKKTKQNIPLRKPLNFDYLFQTCSNNFNKNIKTNEININMEIYEYIGSLRTPPYTKGVKWYVSKNTHFINCKQLNKLKKIWYAYL